MDQEAWNLFVKRTQSHAFQAKSEKFQAMRAMQMEPHTTSRRGYARLDHIRREEIPHEEITRTQVWIEGHKKKNTDNEYSSQAVADKVKILEACSVEKKTTKDITNDAIAEAFGKETRGRVGGMGFGVTPSKVGAQVHQNAKMSRLEAMMLNLSQKVEELSARQPNNQEQVVSGGVASGIRDEVASDGHVNGGGNANNITRSIPRPQINVSSKEIPQGCKLHHWDVDGVVAEGRIASTDSKAKVHHALLSGSCWKVWIDRVYVENVDLPRLTEEMACLDDAIGSTIAWLSKFIELCD